MQSSDQILISNKAGILTSINMISFVYPYKGEDDCFTWGPHKPQQMVFKIVLCLKFLKEFYPHLLYT